MLGLGNVGGAVAQIGNAFGMKVIAWSQKFTIDRAAEVGATLVSRDEVFREADVVTIHLVLSGRTRGLVGAAELALMKPTSRLINTSRGPIVVEADLIAALKDKIIAGAAIDVFDQEPLPLDHPFRALPNLLATPHIGYVPRGLYARFYQDTVTNICRWLDGPWSRRCADHVRLFRRTPNHDRCDRPDLETRADGRLLSVRPITDGDRHGMAGHRPADRGRIRQANRRTGLSPQRGRRSPAPSGRGSAVWQSRLGGRIDVTLVSAQLKLDVTIPAEGGMNMSQSSNDTFRRPCTSPPPLT